MEEANVHIVFASIWAAACDNSTKIADLPGIVDALAKAGFSEKEVNGIMGENWLKLLNRTLPD
jgi:microsomal dipeptidase-like Zn-dependent dipeptidase